MRQKSGACFRNAIDPDIFVLDEPSANLDIKSTENLEKILHGAETQHKKTVIIAEHRLYYLVNVVRSDVICMQMEK